MSAVFVASSSKKLSLHDESQNSFKAEGLFKRPKSKEQNVFKSNYDSEMFQIIDFYGIENMFFPGGLGNNLSVKLFAVSATSISEAYRKEESEAVTKLNLYPTNLHFVM